MRILLTNDDGINAPGLAILEQIARQLSDDVTIVAPELDQSGVSHSFSLNDPLRLRKVRENVYAVKGTPTDCVLMGVRLIMKDNPPDLILSGINHGQNAAEDVTYSGTIAGAMEGTLLGIRSIALSQAYGSLSTRHDLHWENPLAYGADLIRKLLAEGFPGEILININFPDCPPEEMAGVAICVQGRREGSVIEIDERRDGRNNPYYWLALQRGKFKYDHGTDLAALSEKKISVTPLRLDLTDEPTLTRLAGALMP
jgi:5'-nucleotidase